MTLEFHQSTAAPQVAGAIESSIASRVLTLTHTRPLLSAIVVAVLLMLLGIFVFRPSYGTNDDPTMIFIVSGRVLSQTPDEHMVFTHFLIGLLLKHLYLWAPAIPWYALYLFAVHAAAHIALVYLLFKQRLGLRWLAAYFVYAAVVGLMLLTSLTFTTTAFLAVQSGLFLGMFAFLRAAEGDTPLARRTAIASAAFLIAAALIRWHVFMLFFSLALPAACVLAWTHRRQRHLIVKAAGLTGLLLAGLLGLARANDAYYARDPRWGDFYSYNELRARINDLAWVYYSPETAHVFSQVGWSLNDYAMIQAWFFDDPSVYNATKLQELLGAYPWQETMPRQNRVADLFAALGLDPHIISMLVLLPLAVLIVGRNNTAQWAFLSTCLWVCAIILLATLLRKPPPARIYLPVLSFPIALALYLGAVARRPATAVLGEVGDQSSLPPGSRKRSSIAQIAFRPACIALAAIGLLDSLGWQYDRGLSNAEQSEAFYRELESIAADPDQLYIVWGASMPIEHLRPDDSLQWLSNLRVLNWGWPQQCPFHGDMKLLFGLDDLARELAERPDITLISDPACLPLLSTYIREHHGREVAFEPTGRFLTAVVSRALPMPPAVIASQENTPYTQR